MEQRQLPRPAGAGRGNTSAARVLIPGAVGVTAVVVLVAMVLAGCGRSAGADKGVATADSGKPGDSTPTTVTKKDRQQSALEFARCMREHGVDIPDPQIGEDGFVKIGPAPGAAAAQATPIDEEAHEECRHLLGEGLEDGGRVTADPEEQERALRFARCMREHGVDIPDPDFNGGGIGFEIDSGQGLDPSSPTFQEAQEACRQFFGPPGDPDREVQRRAG